MEACWSAFDLWWSAYHLWALGGIALAGIGVIVFSFIEGRKFDRKRRERGY